MQYKLQFDLGVIGLGPSGLKAAQTAKKLGKSVVAFEKNKIGGTCLNLGCVPTKAILHGAKTGKTWKEIISHKNSVVEKLNKAVEKDLSNRGITVVNEEAFLETIQRNASCIIKTKNAEYPVKEIIVASGSKPKELADLPFDGTFILSSDNILNLETLPKSILIVGSGAIGIEWARIMNLMGVDVTVVEAAPSLLPSSDVDIQRRIARIFKMKKIKFYTETTAKADGSDIILSNGETLRPGIVLVAAGREKVLPKGECKNVIGDAGDKTSLAHSGTHQAICEIERIFKNKNRSFDNTEVPAVVYGEPEIASIGLREQDLTDLENYKIYNLPVAYLPKAWCDECTEGFVKLISKDDFIVGAHIISKEASAMITQIAIAMKAKMTITELKKVIFPHPTYSEGIFEALENA